MFPFVDGSPFALYPAPYFHGRRYFEEDSNEYNTKGSEGSLLSGEGGNTSKKAFVNLALNVHDVDDDYYVFNIDKKLIRESQKNSSSTLLLQIDNNNTDNNMPSATDDDDDNNKDDVDDDVKGNNEADSSTDRIAKIEEIFVKNEDLPDAELYCGNVGDSDESFFASPMYLRSCQRQELLRLGMTVTSGSVVIKKDQTNLIGISIGGGAPYCPCLYIVQVFDGTPAAREGTLQSGDELLGVNGQSVKGKTKVAVAKMIQATTDEVIINYNKLHADPAQGETLDIALKKIKHRLVEGMSSSTADSLGLSRAILCNDSLVKRLQELQGTETMYRGLVEHAKRMLKAYFDVLQTYQAFGNCFSALSVREPQPRASEAFRLFGEMHRNLERDGVKMLKAVKPVLADLGTYLTKAIPDTKMTIRRYADAKFAYLSYCLKVKEMDDEEHSYAALQEPIYRVETGNYEYRLVLRCRQDARSKFAQLRSDVLEKMELLESKHARDLACQLKRFIKGLATLGDDAIARLQVHPNLFPVEVDLKDSAFQYKSVMQLQQQQQNDEMEDGGVGGGGGVEEAAEIHENMTPVTDEQNTEMNSLISGFDNIDLLGDNGCDGGAGTGGNEDLLKELGLADIDLSVGCSFDLSLKTNADDNPSSTNKINDVKLNFMEFFN